MSQQTQQTQQTPIVKLGGVVKADGFRCKVVGFKPHHVALQVIAGKQTGGKFSVPYARVRPT